VSSLAWLICSALPLALALTSWRLQTALENDSMYYRCTQVHQYQALVLLQTDSETYTLQFTCISGSNLPLDSSELSSHKGKQFTSQGDGLYFKVKCVEGNILQEVFFVQDRPPTIIIVHQAEGPREVLGWLSTIIIIVTNQWNDFAISSSRLFIQLSLTELQYHSWIASLLDHSHNRV